MAGVYSNDPAYRRAAGILRARTRRDDLPCWICGKHIDCDLPWTEPMSFTADHVRELARGGDVLGEIRPAHRACNSARGGALGGARRSQRAQTRKDRRTERHPGLL